MESLFESIGLWLENSRVSWFMTELAWSWRIFETLHFMGLCLLIGTVGLFDLRLMGVAKPVPLRAFHRLLPWGILGYAINVVTGISFFSAAPTRYMYNPAFQLKILFMLIAGINVLIFYAAVHQKIDLLEGADDAPLAGRIVGGVSLFAWIGVIICGRMLTFYRPPFHWCPWC